MSIEAKVLYGLLLNRMGLSVCNGWMDSDRRIYIYFTQEDAMTLMNCGKDKATKLYRELDKDGIGLIERKKQGQGAVFRLEQIARGYVTAGVTGFDETIIFRGDELPYGSYGAVEPLTGESCFLILPYCDTACMNVFLEEQYPEDMIMLCCDGAAWHKSKTLQVPENIVLFYIPPYTPEMNPIEQIWKELRKIGFRNENIFHLGKSR